MGLRCLIVDDNPSFRRAARALLEAEGVAVVGLASSGTAGFDLATQVQADVVLVDIDLGDENGFDFARRIVDRDDRRSPKVILISAHAGEDFVDAIAESPAVGFVAKAELSRHAIEQLLCQPGARPGDR